MIRIDYLLIAHTLRTYSFGPIKPQFSSSPCRLVPIAITGLHSILALLKQKIEKLWSYSAFQTARDLDICADDEKG